jgi:hypothetical protein
MQTNTMDTLEYQDTIRMPDITRLQILTVWSDIVAAPIGSCCENATAPFLSFVDTGPFSAASDRTAEATRLLAGR